MKAITRYPGAKWKLAEWIISHFPADYEKMVYLEPFCGSGAVFFNKLPGAVEIVNDINSDIYNLFFILRECSEELKRRLELTPYSREEYDNAFLPALDNVDKARKFIIRTTQAIGAKGGKNGWRNHKQKKIGGPACKWAGITNTIDIAAKRLKGDTTHLVQIENMDALRLIERYNNSDVLMYLDPPYLPETRHCKHLYSHEMSKNEHIKMLELIAYSNAKIVLSGYDSQLYRKMLQGWKTVKTESRTTSTEIVTECLWLNYEPPFEQYTLF